MAAPGPLAGLPAAGVFPLDFSASFLATAKGKTSTADETIGLRCELVVPDSGIWTVSSHSTDTFKPASITPSTRGEIEVNKGQPELLSFDVQVCSLVLS